MVAGIGVCMFLALVALLKWQFRKHIYNKVRVRRGLRSYVSSNKDDAADCPEPGETRQLNASH
jgi:hypothetical protein